MRTRFSPALAWVWAWLSIQPCPTSGAGVTVITHGFNGNVTDWIVPMCNKIAQYATLPGTNISIYEISITLSNGSSSTAATAQVSFWLDSDANPYGTNQVFLFTGTLSGTGTNNVSYSALALSPNPRMTPPGTYWVEGSITYVRHRTC